jgi:hypothetical protein
MMISEVCLKDEDRDRTSIKVSENTPIGDGQNIPLDLLGQCRNNYKSDCIPSRGYIKAKLIATNSVSIPALVHVVSKNFLKPWLLAIFVLGEPGLTLSVMCVGVTIPVSFLNILIICLIASSCIGLTVALVPNLTSNVSRNTGDSSNLLS